METKSEKSKLKKFYKTKTSFLQLDKLQGQEMEEKPID